MRFRRPRELIRTCTECGTQWTVPGELGRKRRRRGLSWRESHMFGGGLSNSAAAYALDLAKQRDHSADELDAVTATFERCPSCDAPTWKESTTRRQRDP